jgi:hypothetical protein
MHVSPYVRGMKIVHAKREENTVVISIPNQAKENASRHAMSLCLLKKLLISCCSFSCSS